MDSEKRMENDWREGRSGVARERLQEKRSKTQLEISTSMREIRSQGITKHICMTIHNTYIYVI